MHACMHTPAPSSLLPLPLSRLTPTPHGLEKAIPLRQAVQTVIAFGPRPHEPAQRVHLVFARVAARLVDFAHGDLHAGVVFRFDYAVRGRAFARDVSVVGMLGGG
jgi:hypothetical protein